MMQNKVAFPQIDPFIHESSSKFNSEMSQLKEFLFLFLFFFPFINSSGNSFFGDEDSDEYLFEKAAIWPKSTVERGELDRLKEIARQKLFHLEGKNPPGRRKRDGATFGLAVISGIIGMTSHAVEELTTFHPVPSNGGCKWFGTAPFCHHHCPPEYDLIRRENGRCSNFWLSGFCVPDESFGEPCSTLFGGFFKKRYCCKSDPTECTWSGRWMAAMDNHNVYCRYDNSVGKCGELSCAVNHFERKLKARSPIGGEHCDQLEFFNATGHATCGFIAWHGQDGEMINSWYKTG